MVAMIPSASDRPPRPTGIRPASAVRDGAHPQSCVDEMAGVDDRSPEGRRGRAERAIEERLGSAMLTVANLCRWTAMSRSSLYRLFDADGGVQAYVRVRRLARVAADLRTGGAGRVADVAERWGFCDAAYLARVFREAYGVTPSEYRARHRHAG